MPTPDYYYAFLSRAAGGYLGFFLLISGAVVLYSASPARLRAALPRPALPTLPALRWRVSILQILLLALIVRLPGMFESFWYDETFTGAAARVPLTHLPGVILADVHPPLPYLLAWGTGRIIGTSEIALRLPSLLAGLAVVWAVYDLSRISQIGKRPALLAAVMVALLPAHVYYSNEARAYMLLTLAVLLAMIALLDNKPRLFALSAAALPYLHNIGFVYLAVLILAAYILRPRRRWRFYATWAGLIGLAWLPGAYLQSADIIDGFWLQQWSLGGALQFITSMTVSDSFPPMLVWLIYVPVIAVTSAAALHRPRWYLSTPGRLWLILVLGVPALLSAVSLSYTDVYLDRALLPIATLIVIGWARFASGRPIVLGALALAIGTAAINQQLTTDRVDIRSFYAHCEGADYVYSLSTANAVMAAYYAPAPAYLRPGANDLNQSLSAAGKAALGFRERDLTALHGTVCIAQQFTSMTARNEMEYLRQFTQAAPPLPTGNPLCRVLWPALYSQLFYRFDVYICDMP